MFLIQLFLILKEIACRTVIISAATTPTIKHANESSEYKVR